MISHTNNVLCRYLPPHEMEAKGKQFRDRFRAANLPAINANTGQEEQFYWFLTLWVHSVHKGDHFLVFCQDEEFSPTPPPASPTTPPPP